MQRNFPVIKDYLVNVTIYNDTDHQISEITIEHRSNDKNWEKPSIVKIPKLKPQEEVLIQNWPFGKNKPGTTSNVLLNFIPLVGWIIPAARGWGKDYWSIFCKGSKFTQLLATDSWAQRWYADIFQEDIKKGVLITFNWNQNRNLYWVSIDRKSCGQSTHYLDIKDQKPNK